MKRAFRFCVVGLSCALWLGCSGGDSGNGGVDGADATELDAAETAEIGGESDTTDAGPEIDAGIWHLGCIEGDFTAYWGNIHAHTTLSDGAGPPEEAFEYARDTAGLDFMLLTDHHEQLHVPEDKWAHCHEVADAWDEPGVFVTGCDFEYATGVFGVNGHNNIFFSDSLMRLELYYESLWEDLAACGDCVGQFNHPADIESQTWFDFAYDAVGDEHINLMEFNTGADAWGLFFQALGNGWHVSPTINQDNHDADWGTKNDKRTGFWLSDLSREAVHAAMLERRSFMTEDENASIRMMADQECWMGSILEGRDMIGISVGVWDEDEGDGFDRIELYGPEQELLTTFDCDGSTEFIGITSWIVEGPSWVVARAFQDDGDMLVSAPIWASPSP